MGCVRELAEAGFEAAPELGTASSRIASVDLFIVAVIRRWVELGMPDLEAESDHAD